MQAEKIFSVIPCRQLLLHLYTYGVFLLGWHYRHHVLIYGDLVGDLARKSFVQHAKTTTGHLQTRSVELCIWKTRIGLRTTSQHHTQPYLWLWVERIQYRKICCFGIENWHLLHIDISYFVLLAPGQHYGDNRKPIHWPEPGYWAAVGAHPGEAVFPPEPIKANPNDTAILVGGSSTLSYFHDVFLSCDKNWWDIQPRSWISGAIQGIRDDFIQFWHGYFLSCPHFYNVLVLLDEICHEGAYQRQANPFRQHSESTLSYLDYSNSDATIYFDCLISALMDGTLPSYGTKSDRLCQPFHRPGWNRAPLNLPAQVRLHPKDYPNLQQTSNSTYSIFQVRSANHNRLPCRERLAYVYKSI